MSLKFKNKNVVDTPDNCQEKYYTPDDDYTEYVFLDNERENNCMVVVYE